jgi:D-cysteine desulfhydrase family pyridoxal phosphate-dependent enzyme
MNAPWSELPRERLATLPTPLVRLERFGEAIGAEVWMKRDDVGELGLAGNKVRKLEFVLADARARGADVVVIVGAAQSNAARAAAAACVRLGLRCVVVLSGSPPEETTGNLLLDHLYGATVRFAGTRDWAELERFAEEVRDQLRAEGATPYALPAGASSTLGAVGFAVAWHELLEQLDEAGIEAATVVHASSSGGTHAGLVTGRALTGGGPRVRGIVVAADIYPDVPAQLAALASGAAQLLGAADVPGLGDLWLDMDHIGEGYAIPTPGGVEAIRLLAETEAIVCDPVYSGKALAAVVADAFAGALGGPTVFWHTGGYPAVFARPFGDALLGAG